MFWFDGILDAGGGKNFLSSKPLARFFPAFLGSFSPSLIRSDVKLSKLNSNGFQFPFFRSISDD